MGKYGIRENNGEFIAMLGNKAEEAGAKLVVKVNPSGTSLECIRCGMIVPNV